MMGGGYIASIGAIASKDGKYILTASAAAVRIYSTATAELIGDLRGHTADVTAVTLDPHSSKKVMLATASSRALSSDGHTLYIETLLAAMQVYSASNDGTVRLWDISEASEMKKFEIGAPVKSLVSRLTVKKTVRAPVCFLSLTVGVGLFR